MKAWIATHTGIPCFAVDGTWSITATVAGCDPRPVAQGSGTSMVSDPGAAVDEPTTYTITEDTKTTTTVLIREAIAPRFITDQWGRNPIPIIWQGDDELTHTNAAEIFQPTAAAYPVIRYSKPSYTHGTITIRTDTAGTRTLTRLIKNPQPLWLIHNRTACQIPDCDVEPTRLIALTSDTTNKRTSRIDQAERTWQLTYHLIDPHHQPAVPTVTYAEARQAHFNYGDGSYLDAARKIAGMPR